MFLLCAQLLSFYCHTEVEKKVRVGCEGNAKRQWIARDGEGECDDSIHIQHVPVDCLPPSRAWECLIV